METGNETTKGYRGKMTDKVRESGGMTLRTVRRRRWSSTNNFNEVTLTAWTNEWVLPGVSPLVLAFMAVHNLNPFLLVLPNLRLGIAAIWWHWRIIRIARRYGYSECDYSDDLTNSRSRPAAICCGGLRLRSWVLESYWNGEVGSRENVGVV